MLALCLPFAACGNGRALFLCNSAPLGNCEKVDTCCDSTECFFEVDDRQFPCDEETTDTGHVLWKDCDAAIARLEDYCMAR
jgi:hypothetical protein